MVRARFEYEAQSLGMFGIEQPVLVDVALHTSLDLSSFLKAWNNAPRELKRMLSVEAKTLESIS